MDVIVADMNGGSIMVPDGVSLPLLPEPLLTHMQESLSLFLQPELCFADHAFQPLAVRATPPAMLDKEIPSVFMRTFAQLLQGYQSCLTIIHIHPQPVITSIRQFISEFMYVDFSFISVHVRMEIGGKYLSILCTIVINEVYTDNS
jgi:myotubularin-related protein 5/13